ncbi:MAG: type II toxin-antitoxin system HigA family antitoxin [Cyclobacteriaceae bacterium]
MKTKILKTEQEYNEACERVYKLINSSTKAIESESPEGEEIELLSLLIENYEHEHYPIDAPSPIEAIKFRMEQMNLKQTDIAPLLGGKTRVSEILRAKRPLTLKMIILLNRYLGIPLESLVAGNIDVQLEPENREKLLSNASIKAFVSKSQVVIN